MSNDKRDEAAEAHLDRIEDLEVEEDEADDVAGGATSNQQKTADKTGKSWGGYIGG